MGFFTLVGNEIEISIGKHSVDVKERSFGSLPSLIIYTLSFARLSFLPKQEEQPSATKLKQTASNCLFIAYRSKKIKSYKCSNFLFCQTLSALNFCRKEKIFLSLPTLYEKSHCGCGVIGSRARLRIWCREACRFESYHPHKFTLEGFSSEKSSFLFNFSVCRRFPDT